MQASQLQASGGMPPGGMPPGGMPPGGMPPGGMPPGGMPPGGGGPPGGPPGDPKYPPGSALPVTTNSPVNPTGPTMAVGMSNIPSMGAPMNQAQGMQPPGAMQGSEGASAHSPYANMPSMGSPMATEGGAGKKALMVVGIGCGCLFLASLALVVVFYLIL